MGDTVAGTYDISVSGSTQTVGMADGAKVLATTANSVTVTASGSGAGSITVGSVVGTTSMMTFRHTGEVACLWGGGECPSSRDTLSTGSGSAASHISVIEVGDADLRTNTSLDAAFPGKASQNGAITGGLNGFSKLLGWSLNNGSDLSITIGSPVSYTAQPPSGKNPWQVNCLTGVVSKGSFSSKVFHGGSAIQEDILNIVTNLGTAYTLANVQPGTKLKVRLDLDNTLSHSYYGFVGNSGSDPLNKKAPPGFTCSISQLGSLTTAILAEYQYDWDNFLPGGTSVYPDVTFVMGGSEAPATLYNSPTFQTGYPPSQTGDLTGFINGFNMIASSSIVTSWKMPITLGPTQNEFKFLLLDIGSTENEWIAEAEAVLKQAAASSSSSISIGEIPAVLNSGNLSPLSNNCTLQTYQDYWKWSDPGFCLDDAAAIAAAQLKIQAFLNAGLRTDIIRISSYNFPAPSHLFPDTDPSSLSSLIDWLYEPPVVSGEDNPAQAPTPLTLFKLANVSNGSDHEYRSDLTLVESDILNTTNPWRAEYPLGGLYQQASISSSVALVAVTRYVCHPVTGSPSDFLEVAGGETHPNYCQTSGDPEPLGYVAAGPKDICSLPYALQKGLALSSASLGCPNMGDIAVYRYVSGEEFYYTTYPNDKFVSQPGSTWNLNPSAPVFFLQPNWPNYQTQEPVAFHGGLRTDSQGPIVNQQPLNAPLLNFFSDSTMMFGFQRGSNTNYLGITVGSQFTALICSSTLDVNCGGMNNTPQPCMMSGSTSPSLACESQESDDIAEYPWGGAGVAPGSCCHADTTTNPEPGQEPVMHFYPASPFVTICSSDNSCCSNNGQGTNTCVP